MVEKYVEIPVKHMKRYVRNYTPGLARQTLIINNLVDVEDLPDSIKKLKLSEFVEVCLALGKTPVLKFDD